MGDYWDLDIVSSAVAHQKFDDDVEHPAPFPEKIIILPLLQTTNEGDLVLDPFCGSYTTGRVSQRNNRRFVGYDVKVYQNTQQRHIYEENSRQIPVTARQVAIELKMDT